VTFRPETLRGATDGVGGTIDYRLARRAVVNAYRKGRLAQHEVCDAHPELRRAAAEVARPTSEPCPICEETNVVLVSYVFGPRLPPHGRCITSAREMERLVRQARRGGDFTCYVVEVCPACHWNHLARTFVLGRAS
jgi:hypothetical protein